MVRTIKSPDQFPMEFMLPETDWVPPTELPDLRGRGPIAMDTETRDDGLSAGRGPGWVYRAGYICGVSMAVKGQSIYVPVAHPDTTCFDSSQVARWIDDHMHCGERIVFQNAPYDLGWMGEEWDIRPPEKFDDTMAMSFILDEMLLSRNLDAICRWLGTPGKDETLLRAAAEAYGTDAKSGLWRMPARYVGPYGTQDAVSTLENAAKMRPMIAGQSLEDAYQLEVDIIPMVMEMRRRGIRVDVESALRAQEELLEQRDHLLKWLGHETGMGRAVTMQEFNSESWLVRNFEKEQVKYPRTARGNPSFAAEWMERHEHWLPSTITKINKLHDAGDKFIGKYILDYTHHGRIHADIHSYKDDRGGTRTTRFSYSDPPLQQMPSRDPKIAKTIRSLFLPEEGEIWGAPDYSQQEFRLMVHFASVCNIVGVDEAVRMYREDPNTDFHNLARDLTGLPRRSAKDVNFAKAFGAGRYKFALMTGMTVDESVKTMAQYDEKLPFIKGLSEFCQKRANQRGYLRLIDGARSRFEFWEPRWTDWERQEQWKIDHDWPDMPTGPCRWEEARERRDDPRHYWSTQRLQRAWTHKAMNSLIQGSAARQTKLAMRECWREGIVPLLQMHDELSASFGSEAPALRMREIMIEVVELVIPVKVDLEFGITWGDAKATEDYGATWEEARRMAA